MYINLCTCNLNLQCGKCGKPVTADQLDNANITNVLQNCNASEGNLWQLINQVMSMYINVPQTGNAESEGNLWLPAIK